MNADQYFAAGCGALLLAGALPYVVHALRRGKELAARIDKVGGSPFLNRQIVEMGYWSVRPLTQGCVALGLTPNMLTWMSLLLGIGAGVAFAFGWLGLGALQAMLSAILDILDGQVARMTNTGSEAGEVFDASVDRYTETACFGGLIFFYRDHLALQVVALMALLGAYMVSYATAKAEALQIEPPKGAMRRHERAAYLITTTSVSSLAAGLTARFAAQVPAPFVVLGLLAIAVVGNASAIRRLMLTSRAVAARSRARTEAAAAPAGAPEPAPQTAK